MLRAMAYPAMSSAVRDILAALLAFDTTSRESNLALITWIEDFLAQRGIASQRIMDDSGRKANLYARLGPGGDGGVMLSGHTDVVPVDGQQWTLPPFALTQQKGRYYGRGSADMKGFLACVLASLDSFWPSRCVCRCIWLFPMMRKWAASGCGAWWSFACVSRKARHVYHRRTDRNAPVYGHKGKVAMRCQVHGRACHSAYAPSGVNAIEYAARLINQLGEAAQQLKQIEDARFDPPL
ncbi:Acetylornithine deacetylase [Raoultella planticola]|uniref:Acetylornithine deacetylase n=1 Tax=Raoultella planticola TaxID=575 RepID=A0A485ADJ4_RAOPL|nr:Acetylornithine deacetylase [Raoultella planticola]